MSAITKPMDDVGVTFVNTVLGQGELNGNVNLTLGTALFSPTVDTKIDADIRVSCRLRMDKACARQIYESLGRVLGLHEDQPAEAHDDKGGIAAHPLDGGRPN